MKGPCLRYRTPLELWERARNATLNFYCIVFYHFFPTTALENDRVYAFKRKPFITRIIPP